jgi:hypothetical protein
MPLILGANSLTGGYEVDNSLRFNSGSSDNLSRTPASAVSRQICTYSAWIKISEIATERCLISASPDGSNYNAITIGRDSGVLRYYEVVSNSTLADVKTSQLFRDPSAWYHIVVAIDSTQATSSNRIKIYVNGSQVTSFLLNTVFAQNTNTSFGSNCLHTIGRYADVSAGFFNGYHSEVYFINGQQLDPTDFGEFDEDSGIWKPIAYEGTYGTNGFYLEFQDSSALGDDTSGNGNDFTVNNLTSIDQTTDTPTNNFATMNPLAVPPSNIPTFAEGNTKVSTNTTNANPVLSTMGVSQGKWYVEAKRISYDGGTGDDDGFRIGFGVTYVQDVNLVPPAIVDSGHYFMIGNGTVYNGSTDLGVQGGDSNISDNGVVQIALDLDNNQISWGFDNSWMDGAGGWSGSSPSNYVTIPSGYTYFFLQTDGSNGRAYTAGWNFGGTSAFAISTGNTDANGYGNFEYLPPAGFLALCTANLATDG